MHNKIKILYLEDNPVDVEYIKEVLKSENFDFELSHVSSRNEFISKLTNDNDFDIILCDYSLPGFDGFSALQISKQLKPDLPFVLISGELGEEHGIESLKKGASDYVLKHRICRLAPAITRALKEAEIMLEKKKAEKELIEAKERAEESDRLKSAFLAQVSHEIRTPLNIIVNYSSMVKEALKKEISPELNFMFESIEKGSSRLIRTIDLMLNVSALKSAQIKVYKKYFDLEETLKKLIQNFQSEAEKKNIKLLFRSGAGSTIIYANEYCITQMFQNLIDNAIKYTESGFVEVAVSKDDNDNLTVQCKDTGIGISESFLPTLFNEFTQEETGYSRRFDGNGLGLALSKKYAELNDAVIAVESKKNIGSTFSVKFSKNGTRSTDSNLLEYQKAV